jgi:hypothetical protein
MSCGRRHVVISILPLFTFNKTKLKVAVKWLALLGRILESGFKSRPEKTLYLLKCFVVSLPSPRKVP